MKTKMSSAYTRKMDLTKIFPEYYKAYNIPRVVDLAAINYLSIEGVGAPEGKLFNRSIEAIYPVAYTVKKYCKADGNDFVVPKMEGLWWVDSEQPFGEVPRDEWQWNILIRMPEFVTIEMVDEAVEEVIAEKSLKLASEVHLKPKKEGKSVQAMHIGSYEEEGETIQKIFNFMNKEGLEMNGYHHEIYLSDPRKTPVERLKTIIRYPVK